MKSYKVLPIILVVYALVVAVISYPRYKAAGNWGEFWGIIGACVVVAILLYFVLKRKNETRNRYK
jgi:putative effector of murein hydrolase